jgi:hypothetical protein
MASDRTRPTKGNQPAQTRKSASKSLHEMRTAPSADPIDRMLPERWRDLVSVVIIFLSLVFFFMKALDKDHTFNAGDNVASESFKPFTEASQKAGVDVPQWIPNIFSGMPAFAALVVTGNRTNDVVHEIFDLVQSVPVALFGNTDGMTNVWHYFILGLGMFLFMRVTRNTTRLAALFTAFSAMFSAWIITYVMIGHNTKVFAIMTMPYIFMGVEMLRRKGMKWQMVVFWCALLGTSFHFLLESTHMQMAFYIFLAILIYFIYGVINDLIRKEGIVPILRAGVLSLLMVGFAFAMSADRYMSTLGYEPFSIRGSAPIADNSGDAPKKASSTAGVDKSGGLDWDYATQWSFSPGEMITFIVPGWFGYGKMPYSGGDLNVPDNVRLPTYWGQMPFTDTANYTGIIVLLLAVVGIFVLWKKDRIVGPLAIISVFAILLSFGGTFPVVFGPMFHNFPVFNKFRAPSMALVLMQLCFPILAGLMLEYLLKIWKANDRQEESRVAKYFQYAMYAGGALLIVFLIGRSAFESSMKADMAKSGKSYVSTIVSLQEYVASVAMNDAVIGMLLLIVASGLIFMFLRRMKVSPFILGVGIFVLSAFDLWRVDTRPLEITTKAEYDEHFANHDYVDFIKQDKGLYRVLDLNNAVSNSIAAFGMQTIAGYHAAKMRSYQDVVDITGNANGNVINNPFMWNMLNTKYIIANGAITEDQARFTPVYISKEQTQAQEGQQKAQPTVVWQNPQALPRVFLVRHYEVKAPIDQLHAMHDGVFDPRDVLYFDKEPEGLGVVDTNQIDQAKEHADVTSYKNESVEIKTNTQGDRLVFMSDNWYPDWTATLDGKPLTIYKADHTFRAMKVPAGEHTIKLTYYDARYAQGRTISLIANILAIAGIIVGIGGAVGGRKKKAVEEKEEPSEETPEA